MSRRFVLLAVVFAVFAPVSVSAASRSDVVSNLKKQYRVDLFWNSGHLEPGSARVVAANLERQLRLKHTLANNLSFRSGVRSYTHSYTVGAGPFKRTVKVRRYLAWAGAKWNNPFQGPNGGNTQAFVNIYNQTRNPIFFSLSINGGRFQEYRVDAGKYYTFRGAGRPPRFSVRFDSSFAAGFQAKQYNLRANSHNDFKLAGSGIDLYHR